MDARTWSGDEDADLPEAEAAELCSTEGYHYCTVCGYCHTGDYYDGTYWQYPDEYEEDVRPYNKQDEEGE